MYPLIVITIIKQLIAGTNINQAVFAKAPHSHSPGEAGGAGKEAEPESLLGFLTHQLLRDLESCVDTHPRGARQPWAQESPSRSAHTRIGQQSALCTEPGDLGFNLSSSWRCGAREVICTRGKGENSLVLASFQPRLPNVKRRRRWV